MNGDLSHTASGKASFKYQRYLNAFSDCPPSTYESTAMLAFRWVHAEPHPNDFMPLHLISDPPDRMLDEFETMCKGYGLSMFGSREAAKQTYLKATSRKRPNLLRSFVEEKGDAIAELQLREEDGISSQPNDHGSGHFTFHEYKGTNLYNRIISKTPIFE